MHFIVIYMYSGKTSYQVQIFFSFLRISLQVTVCYYFFFSWEGRTTFVEVNKATESRRRKTVYLPSLKKYETRFSNKMANMLFLIIHSI
jgi:hypothetical protein